MRVENIKRLETLSVILLLLTSDINLPPAIDQFIKYVSYPIIILLIFRQSLGRMAYFATRDWSLLILCLFACSSIFWSENPAVTADQLKALIRAILLGTYLAVRYSPREQMRLLSWVIGIAAVLSLFVSLAIPSYGTNMVNHLFVWQGIYAHKQYLARAMTVGSMVFFIDICISRRYYWLKTSMLLLTLILIWMSTSRTGLGFLLLSIYIMPLYRIAKQNFGVREIILLSAVIINFSIAVIILTNLNTIVVDMMGKNLEFNGRLPLWENSIAVGLRRPWFGYGYAGFWSSSVSLEAAKGIWIRAGLGINHAHSGFIDTFLQLGIVGLILLTFSFLNVIFNSIYLLIRKRSIESLWMLEMILLTLCFNIFELNTILTSNFLWVYYISISLTLAIEIERMKIQDLQSKKLNLLSS